MGPQSSCGTTSHTVGPVGVTNRWMHPQSYISGNEPRSPPDYEGEIKESPHYSHQRADSTNSSSQNMMNKITHKPPNGANTNTMDHKGQNNLVSRPERTEKTEEPQEQKHHEEILSVQIDDTHKSSDNAKVSSTEATALPSRVINTNAGPAIVVTSASDNELINLGQYRLRIKLGDKTFEYYFQILKNLK